MRRARHPKNVTRQRGASNHGLAFYVGRHADLDAVPLHGGSLTGGPKMAWSSAGESRNFWREPAAHGGRKIQDCPIRAWSSVQISGPQPPAGKRVTRLPLRNSNLMSAIGAGGLPDPFVAARGPTSDRRRPSGIFDWRLAESRASPPMLPSHRDQNPGNVRPRSTPSGQYPTLPAGGEGLATSSIQEHDLPEPPNPRLLGSAVRSPANACSANEPAGCLGNHMCPDMLRGVAVYLGPRTGPLVHATC
jgi:hypothetical protein